MLWLTGYLIIGLLIWMYTEGWTHQAHWSDLLVIPFWGLMALIILAITPFWLIWVSRHFVKSRWRP
jgi:hypothetical protein